METAMTISPYPRRRRRVQKQRPTCQPLAATFAAAFVGSLISLTAFPMPIEAAAVRARTVSKIEQRGDPEFDCQLNVVVRLTAKFPRDGLGALLATGHFFEAAD
jgi:hypothetical protein